MTTTVTTASNGETTGSFVEMVSSLPATQTRGTPGWRRTQIFPFAAIALCNDCKQFLPITEYYIYNQKKPTRKDILNQPRASHCRKCANIRFLKIDHRSKMLNSARQRAKMKGLEFDITIDDVVIPEYCPVLGIKLEATVGTGRRNLNELENSPSIDRIDNSRGYTKDNIMVISLRANNLKKDATLQEVKALVRYMEEFQAGSATNHAWRMVP